VTLRALRRNRFASSGRAGWGGRRERGLAWAVSMA
jgi:hypothetical protein